MTYDTDQDLLDERCRARRSAISREYSPSDHYFGTCPSDCDCGAHDEPEDTGMCREERLEAAVDSLALALETAADLLSDAENFEGARIAKALAAEGRRAL